MNMTFEAFSQGSRLHKPLISREGKNKVAQKDARISKLRQKTRSYHKAHNSNFMKSDVL